MKPVHFLMFISISNQGGGYWNIAWILSRDDQLEVQRHQYEVKPINEVFRKSSGAYFPTYVTQILERSLSLYDPTLVVIDKKQAADITDGFGIARKVFSEVTVLDDLARARGASMEDLYSRALTAALVKTLSTMRRAEAVKTCYFELVGRNLTVGGYVKQLIGLPGKRGSGSGVPSAPKQVSSRPANEGNDQKGCIWEIWDFFIMVFGWLILAYFGVIILMLLLQGIEYIISQFR